MMAPMTCGDARPLIEALLDGELPPSEAATVSAHLAGCAECRAHTDAIRALGTTLRARLGEERAPAMLQRRVLGSIQGNAPSNRRLPSWIWQAAAAVALVVASSVATRATMSRGTAAVAMSALVDRHVHALMSERLTDVTSTDEHNVKPWFDGKVAFAPEVPRLDSAGFPLMGGRVDTVAGTPAAALVYGRRKHLINVFVWPGNSSTSDTAARTERGYNVLRWSRGDLLYAAVSDLGMVELREFAQRFIAER